MANLDAGDMVIIPAVDRLSRDTTDLLVIARDVQRAGAGLRSFAEPVVDTTSDFGELVLAMLGVAAKLERRRIIERTARARIEAGETQRSVARSYNVGQTTISRLAA
jgi:DNA invertase Pin-like site-specific DNA recombinase